MLTSHAAAHRSLLITLFALLALAAAPTAQAMTIAESTFDTDLDGWTYNDATDSTFDFEATGGNPGGFALWVDSRTMSNFSRIDAPAKFLGDWSAYDGVGQISYDQIMIAAGDVAAFEDLLIRIDGADGSVAVFRDRPVNIGATGEWITTIAPLVETEWIVAVGSWASLLADVSQMQILVERVENSGSNVETVGTDNVRLAVVPEPSTALLLGIGLCGLAWKRAARRQSLH